MRTRRRTALSLIIGAWLGCTQAGADTVVGNPVNWRLQNYTGGNVVVWGTGASGCTSALSFSAGISEDDKNRFWSMVLSAKMTSHLMGMEYTNSGGTCTINSFFMDG